VERPIRPGTQPYGWWARPCGRFPGLCLAVRLAAVDDGPDCWPRLLNLQPRQRRDRLRRHAVLQVGLHAEPQASGAAAWACQPAAQVERPDLSWQWMCSTRQVRLEAAARESPEVAA
jgi:hypothetical protein